MIGTFEVVFVANKFSHVVRKGYLGNQDQCIIDDEGYNLCIQRLLKLKLNFLYTCVSLTRDLDNGKWVIIAIDVSSLSNIKDEKSSEK